MEGEHVGMSEDGRPIPVEEFPYEQVDADIFGTSPESDLVEIPQADLDLATKALRSMLQWVAQPGSKNTDGIQLRAIVICWIFLKEFRPLQLTELAKGFGKDKQSLGRHVDHFKRTFPRMRTSHMRPLDHE